MWLLEIKGWYIYPFNLALMLCSLQELPKSSKCKEVVGALMWIMKKTIIMEVKKCARNFFLPISVICFKDQEVVCSKAISNYAVGKSYMRHAWDFQDMMVRIMNMCMGASGCTIKGMDYEMVEWGKHGSLWWFGHEGIGIRHLLHESKLLPMRYIWKVRVLQAYYRLFHALTTPFPFMSQLHQRAFSLKTNSLTFYTKLHLHDKTLKAS